MARTPASAYFPSVALLAVFTLHAAAQVQETKPNPAIVSISVDPDSSKLGQVPATLFGSFIEPIGDSINQGLSAEILVNGSLEEGLWNHTNLERMFADQPELVASSIDTQLPLPWLPLHMAAGRRYEVHRDDAANSWQSVEIMGNQDPAAGILQRVYLPAQRTLGYKVSLYVRHLVGSPEITVELRKHGSDTVLAKATLNATQSGWTKYSTSLALKTGDVQPMAPVDFAIEVAPNERVDVDEISLMPDDAIDGLDPDVVAMAKAMNSTQLRFGGNFSSQYHWREGVGPADKRLTVENGAWGIPEDNTFGIDELLRFCDLIHAVPQININMGSGTPEEAADWVRYIHDRYKKPVIYELGNELYGNLQVGHITADEIAGKTLAFSQAVRAVDPKAEVIATGGMPQHFEKWNAAQLTNPPGTFQLLSTHFIRVTNVVELSNPSAEFVAAAAYALPVEVGRDFQRMQAQVDASSQWRGKVHFAMDEWLFNSRGKGDRVFTNQSPSSKNEGGGLMVAGVFNTLFRNSQIVPFSDITGLMEFAGIWKRRQQAYATPSYYIFRLYSGVKGDTILTVKTGSGLYSLKGGIQEFTDIADVPYVDVVATLSPDRKNLTLFCINRDLANDLPVRIDLGSFAPASVAQVEQLKSASRYDQNDEAHPRNVVPQTSSLALANGAPITYTLPHESVTMLRFHSR